MYRNQWNKYDVFLIILIASLAGGVVGGAVTPTRVLAILFLPQFIYPFFSLKKSNVYFLVVFFLMWYVYALFSVLWTTDRSEAFKELIYYPVHFLYFLEIVTFARYATNPIKNVAVGWVLGFFITAPIALWELITDNHLYTSKFDSNRLFNAGNGQFLLHRFCAGTYDNYNSYVTFLSFAFPFFLYYGVADNSKKILFVLSVVLTFLFVVWNASRGGLISVAGMLLLFWVFTKNNKLKNILFVSLAFFLVSIFVESSDALAILFSRLEVVSTNNNVRFLIWKAAIELWESTYYIGSGIGSMQSAMKDFSTVSIFITHNLFLEVLVQYGFFVFVPFVACLIKMFKDSFSVKENARKNVVVVAFLLLPVISIINSGYLLQPYTVAFFSSLYIYTYYEYT